MHPTSQVRTITTYDRKAKQVTPQTAWICALRSATSDGRDPRPGGYRAVSAASDRHAARLAFQRVSVLIANSGGRMIR